MRLKLLGALSILMLFLIPYVFADFPDGFDSYPDGTRSPLTAGNPWTVSYDSPAYSACFTNQPVSGDPAVYNLPGSISKPNVYAMGVANNATCFGSAHFVRLSITLNSTSTSIFMRLYRELATSAPVAGSSLFSAVFCGVSFASGDMHSEPVSWAQVNDTENSTPGASCVASFALITIPGGTPAAAGIYVDNTVFKNLNAVFTSANYIVFDQGTGGWFNISDYKNSFVNVDYGTGSPTTYQTPGFNGLYAPDMILNTLNANSIVLNIGAKNYSGIFYPGYTAQMLVPTGGCTTVAKCEIYIGAPQTLVFAYAFAITDLSGNFPAGSVATITQGTRLFSSGLTDPEGYAASLVPGKYTFTLTNGAHTYSTAINLPASNGYTQPIQILKLTVSGNCGPACTIGYDARFNSTGTGIIVVYNDTSLGTTRVNMALEKQNGSGTFELYNAVFTGTYGSLQNTIACNSNQCNTTLASQLFVVLDYSGPGMSGTANIAVSGGSALANRPNIPTCILEWCVTFPNVDPLAFIAYALILSCSAVFGAYSAKFGVIVISVLASAFIWFGWLPLAPGAATLFIALGVTSFIAYLEQGR